MDKLDQWLQGTVHADKVFDHARRSFVANMTGMSFEECLHRATVDATAAAVRSFMGSDEVVERVARAIADDLKSRAVYVSDDLRNCLVDGGLFDLHDPARAALSAAIGEPEGALRIPDAKS